MVQGVIYEAMVLVDGTLVTRLLIEARHIDTHSHYPGTNLTKQN